MMCRTDIEPLLQNAENALREITENDCAGSTVNWDFNLGTKRDELRKLCLELLIKKPLDFKDTQKARFLALLFNQELSLGLGDEAFKHLSSNELIEIKVQLSELIIRRPKTNTTPRTCINILARTTFAGEIVHTPRLRSTSLNKGTLQSVGVFLEAICQSGRTIEIDDETKRLINKQSDDWLKDMIKYYPNIARAYKLQECLQNEKVATYQSIQP